METEPSTAFSTCLQFRILSIRRYCFLITKSWCVFDPIPERGFVVRIVPSPMVLAEFTSPVRSLQLPVVRNLPVREFSSKPVLHRRDAPPWNCAPTPAARTAPGNGSGQTNVPASLTNIIAIAAGSDFGIEFALAIPRPEHTLPVRHQSKSHYETGVVG